MASGIPYLGSKISLISRSEIRYEGILYTIDTKESTVALAKVRSYGTEDRPTDRPVAPRDETYEYIIFRGADIKDIRVCQPPKPRPTLEGGLPNDPAIVQHSRGPPMGGLPGGGPGGSPGQGPTPVGGESASSGAGGSVANQFASGDKAPGSSGGGRSSYGPIGSGAPGGPVNQSGGNQHSSGSPVMDLLRDGQSGASSPGVGGHRPSSRTSGGAHDGQARRGRGGFRGGRGGQNRGGAVGPGGPQGNHGFRGGHQNGTRGGMRGGFQPGRPSMHKKETLKFDSEYDFETANEEFKEFISKFQKTGLEGESDKANSADGNLTDEVKEGQITDERTSKDKDGAAIVGGAGSGSADSAGDVAPCYDKSKSFFDSISCEAIERQKGKSNKPDWKAEKKLNRETFGVTGNMGRRNYYHNNRGNYRGGGGGYGNYNRGGGGAGGYGYSNRGGYGGGGHANGGNYGYNNGYNNGNRYNNRGRGSWNHNQQGGRGFRQQRGGARPWGDVRE